MKKKKQLNLYKNEIRINQNKIHIKKKERKNRNNYYYFNKLRNLNVKVYFIFFGLVWTIYIYK